MFIDMYQDTNFELKSIQTYNQEGTFVIVKTEYPNTTNGRLNGGWVYREPNPRSGTRSPPLAFETGWRHCKTWNVSFTYPDILQNSHFINIFGIPNIVKDIEKDLMKDDNIAFPELRAKGMSKNGLENIRYTRAKITKKASDSEDRIISDLDYTNDQCTIDQFTIKQIDKIIILMEKEYGI